ncbi:Six-hairpin glycosidase-like protein [Lactifluus volemus]|nr:Six-hairpin glycosidase-like protein [Lactifluus volemus]
MRPLSILLVLTAAIGVSASPYINTNRLDNPKIHAYFDKEVPIALDVLRDDIGGPSIGADPGVLITLIPEPDHPDYNIFWLRDACLGYLGWLGELELSNDPHSPLRALVDDAVHALIRTQHLINPSGNIFTGGLEEALFDLHIDLITINSWRIGSPAADGPPLRAVVLLKYADWLLRPEQNNGTWVADVLWPAINLDLQWIAGHWNASSWDLWWPPVWGGSYWTSSVQYRALRAGARLGREIGRVVDTAGYDGIASTVLDYTKSFWNPEKGYMTETTITNVSEGGRSGIGCAPLTVSVLNYDPTLGCDSATFQPCSDRALSSLKVVGDAFKELFPINKGLQDQFPFFGFFLEDQLYGGQVQYFASFNVAEQIFDALNTWDRLGELEVTSVSLKFFRDFDKTIRIGKYKRGSGTYERLKTVLNKYAENTIISLAERTPSDFIIPLVMDKVTGKPIPPRGALRSQVAVLGAHNAYNHVIPPSWANGRAPKSLGKQVPCNYGDEEGQFPVGL